MLPLRRPAVAIALLVGAVGHADPAADAPSLIARYHAEGSFIDNPFALSADGRRIAWLTTDGATHTEVHLATIGDKGEAPAFPFDGITPERVEFLDGERVLVVDRSADSGFARAQVYGADGPRRERFGPVTGIALATVDGTPAIVTYLKASAKGGTRHEFIAYRRDTLKPLARKTLVENAGRITVGGALYKPLFFEDGYAVLVAQKEGAYDKARDIRKPDLEARLAVFGGKVVGEREIGDLVAWTQLVSARAKHPNESRFVRFSDDLARLELVDGDRVVELATPRPLHKYDPQTLAYEAGGDGLTLSLTIDPVNPDAVRAQKADIDWLDVYGLDDTTHALAPLARLDGGKRPTAWRLGGTRLAVLRKHKGFGRGGPDLEVYELAHASDGKAPPAKGSAKPIDRAGAAEHVAATKQATDRPPSGVTATGSPTTK